MINTSVTMSPSITLAWLHYCYKLYSQRASITSERFSAVNKEIIMEEQLCMFLKFLGILCFMLLVLFVIAIVS